MKSFSSMHAKHLFAYSCIVLTKTMIKHNIKCFLFIIVYSMQKL